MPTPAETAFDPEVIAIVSDAFCRSWNFIERDPTFAGHDRDALRTELARAVLGVASRGERDSLRIANHVIGGIRDKAQRAETSRRMA
jgi:hypothetical protein